MNDYTTGKQPCDAFLASKESNAHGTWENEHECYAPFIPGSDICGAPVSWCENCHKDHHSGGYDTCTYYQYTDGYLYRTLPT